MKCNFELVMIVMCVTIFNKLEELIIGKIAQKMLIDVKIIIKTR